MVVYMLKWKLIMALLFACFGCGGCVLNDELQVYEKVWSLIFLPSYYIKVCCSTPFGVGIQLYMLFSLYLSTSRVNYVVFDAGCWGCTYVSNFAWKTGLQKGFPAHFLSMDCGPGYYPNASNILLPLYFTTVVRNIWVLSYQGSPRSLKSENVHNFYGIFVSYIVGDKILDFTGVSGHGFVLPKARRPGCHLWGVSGCYVWCEWCEVGFVHVLDWRHLNKTTENAKCFSFMHCSYERHVNFVMLDFWKSTWSNWLQGNYKTLS